MSKAPSELDQLKAQLKTLSSEVHTLQTQLKGAKGNISALETLAQKGAAAETRIIEQIEKAKANVDATSKKQGSTAEELSEAKSHLAAALNTQVNAINIQTPFAKAKVEAGVNAFKEEYKAKNDGKPAPVGQVKNTKTRLSKETGLKALEGRKATAESAAKSAGSDARKIGGQATVSALRDALQAQSQMIREILNIVKGQRKTSFTNILDRANRAALAVETARQQNGGPLSDAQETAIANEAASSQVRYSDQFTAHKSAAERVLASQAEAQGQETKI